jgi:hypothetical protein
MAPAGCATYRRIVAARRVNRGFANNRRWVVSPDTSPPGPDCVLPPTAPFVRDIQHRQLEVALPWAADLLNLHLRTAPP